MLFLELLLSLIVSLLIVILRVLFKTNKSIGRLEGRETTTHKRLKNVEHRIHKLEVKTIEISNNQK